MATGMKELENMSNSDLKIAFKDIYQWNTKGVMPKDGIVLKMFDELEENLLKKNYNYDLKDFTQDILFEIGKRFFEN